MYGRYSLPKPQHNPGGASHHSILPCMLPYWGVVLQLKIAGCGKSGCECMIGSPVPVWQVQRPGPWSEGTQPGRLQATAQTSTHHSTQHRLSNPGYKRGHIGWRGLVFGKEQGLVWKNADHWVTQWVSPDTAPMLHQVLRHCAPACACKRSQSCGVLLVANELPEVIMLCSTHLVPVPSM
jgi:hypothetical protein